MTLGERSKAIEEEIEKFEEQNPELANTVRLMGLTIEEYNNITMNMYANNVVTSNSTEG